MIEIGNDSIGNNGFQIAKIHDPTQFGAGWTFIRCPDNGHIEFVRMAVYLRTFAIVSVQGMGHLEIKALCDPDPLHLLSNWLEVSGKVAEKLRFFSNSVTFDDFALFHDLGKGLYHVLNVALSIDPSGNGQSH